MTGHIRLHDTPRPGTTDSITYAWAHAHDWIEVGVQQWPVGTWHPLFSCTRCGDVVVDLSVDAGDPGLAVPRLWEGDQA